MEQKNSQELDKKIFSDLIQDPTAITAGDSLVLGSLIEKFPYSQLLRSFFVRSLHDSDTVNFEKELTRAALISPDRNLLRIIIEDSGLIKNIGQQSYHTVTTRVESPPDTIVPDSEETEPETNAFDIDHSNDNPKEVELANEESDNPDTEKEKGDEFPLTEETEKAVIEESANKKFENNDSFKEDPEEELTLTETTRKAINTESAEIGTENNPEAEQEKSSVEVPTGNEEEPAQLTSDERDHDLAANLIDSLVKNDEIDHSKIQPEEDELDLLVKQNLASADFLKDDERLNKEMDNTEDVFKPDVDIAENITHNAVIEGDQKISRYDDDKMPYSFLWWLSKTRKEHTDNYQPYVSFILDTSQSIKRNNADQLRSQIIENIFHLQSTVGELENAPKTVPFQVKRKEDYILDKFIREEPQIKAPNSEKLNNENKARRSAEDSNDLVSETLAQIYTDQMLFHKAIETYKKLSLKFPEKSTYFADQIQELEKKIN